MYKVNRPHQAAARYKTKLCCGWLANGHCPYEFKCMFAHGDHELRTKEMNLADGLTHDEAVRAHQWRLWAAGYGAAASISPAVLPMLPRKVPSPPAPIDADDFFPASCYEASVATSTVSECSPYIPPEPVVHPPPRTRQQRYQHRPYDADVVPPSGKR